MPLAIFDLDNTLLKGDSDHAWGMFLADRGIVDAASHRAAHDRYYADYVAGSLDINEFLEFQLAPLKSRARAELEGWRREFIARSVMPMITPPARELVDMHRRRGDTLIIITATNSFITEPIAREFGVDHLIATEPEQADGLFTGRVAGVPCYREGKVTRLTAWMHTNGATLAGSWFYSDSHNDLPLLEVVDHAVAVNPDNALETAARARNWPVLDLGYG